jgi:anaerobic selenocysteine-containing dehydrogenase
MMHNVITNAVKGDPYRIDTLMLFMANMAWNSTMNTMGVREMLNRKDASGEYMIPFLVVCDAFQSETVAFADLVLPDTTYLERHDVMGMLDRPISEFDGPVDSVRVPVVQAAGPVPAVPGGADRTGRAAEVSGLHHPEGGRKFTGYPDFVVNFQPQPGIGFLMGWRGKDGTEHLRGEPNPKQWEMYAEEQLRVPVPHARDHALHAQLEPRLPRLRQGQGLAPAQRPDPAGAVLRHAAELSAWPRRARPGAASRPSSCASASHLLRPAAVLVRAAGEACTDLAAYPLNAITQRPMAMYHSWDSQNAWLRQIHSHNYLHVNPRTAQAAGIADGGWCWVESQWGQVRCMLRYSEAVEPGTVWTWNAIGKADGAWQLAPGADEARKGFLLNHLISEELPFRCSRATDGGGTISNSDPITGQAGWYDVRVRIRPAAPDEEAEESPADATVPAAPACWAGPASADLLRGAQDTMIQWLKDLLQPALNAPAPATPSVRARAGPAKPWPSSWRWSSTSTSASAATPA